MCIYICIYECSSYSSMDPWCWLWGLWGRVLRVPGVWAGPARPGCGGRSRVVGVSAPPRGGWACVAPPPPTGSPEASGGGCAPPGDAPRPTGSGPGAERRPGAPLRPRRPGMRASPRSGLTPRRTPRATPLGDPSPARTATQALDDETQKCEKKAIKKGP